jgi:hypothetical protein
MSNHIIEGGTDVAGIVLFDPEALPPDFDSMKAEQFEALQELHQAQSLYYWDTHADGGYLLHAFVDEPVADYLLPYLQEATALETFDARSGRVFFAGAEYVFHHDDSRLRKYPHMGGQFAITPGRYRVTVYETDYPDGMMEGEFKELVAPAAWRLHDSMGWLILLAVLGVIATGVVLVKAPRGLVVVLPSALLFVALPFIVSGLPLYRRAGAVWQEVQRRYPGLVAEFRRRDSESIQGPPGDSTARGVS